MGSGVKETTEAVEEVKYVDEDSGNEGPGAEETTKALSRPRAY